MVFDVTDKRVTVAGAARSGIAAAELLVRRGARVTLSESRAEAPEAERCASWACESSLAAISQATFADADLVVLSPGVPADQPVVENARARGVPVIGEIELASRWLRGRIIAITGTKGKSTTTALTGRILETAGFKVTVGGNIGLPLSAQVSGVHDPTHCMSSRRAASSWSRSTRSTRGSAVLLNFSPDHLDRHATVESYASAKARIFENQEAGDWVVVNADDPAALEMARRGRAKRGERRPGLFGRRSSPVDGTAIENGWIVDRRARATPPCGSCRSTRFICTARIWSTT